MSSAASFFARGDAATRPLLLLDDAEHLIVAYGGVARASLYVAKELRKQGIKVGLFVPKVLWPFPQKAISGAITDKIKNVIVPEMNLGQYSFEIERAAAGRSRVTQIPKVSGDFFSAQELFDNVLAVIEHE